MIRPKAFLDSHREEATRQGAAQPSEFSRCLRLGLKMKTELFLKKTPFSA
jgi:hypothetical protein